MIGRPMNAIVERYDRDAADYERYWAPVLRATARRLLDFVDDYVRFVIRRDGGVRILEVGAGTGSLLQAALERWPQATFVATEPRRRWSSLRAKRLDRSSIDAGDRVEFVVSPADALALGDASVDLVISTFVLQLVPDRIAALREALRVLAPSGMAAYLTWLDRDARQPFLPGEEFDDAVFDLEIDEPEGTDEPHAGDVRSAADCHERAAQSGLRQGDRRARICSNTTGRWSHTSNTSSTTTSGRCSRR